MRTQLLSHNKTAYQKVVKAFETSDRTCVVHPTGTGKSYLIAAVSESYRRVLILGPNVFVLNQVRSVLEWRGEGIEYMTYSLLLMKEAMPTGYDLICLDEFHRAGAPEWGEAVDRLLEANPSVKVLGTSATPIRFLDDNRDMADELFGGNIASYMSLPDAWNRNILATPTFVTGLFEFDRVTSDMAERIDKSHRINPDEKKHRLTRVNNLRLEWERSQGMPQIIRKHIDPKARRIIVFCGNVEKLRDMEQTVCGWFRRAGFTIGGCYAVHAYMTGKDLGKAMTDFESDTDEGVKLMLSVNMLNEGIHIPRVNAVILLRTTSSKIIYLQQIGRCLTAANTDRPVILDMVDNITTTSLEHTIREGYDWYEHQKPHDEQELEREPLPFTVIDYTMGIRQAIEKLVPQEVSYASFEERVAIIRAFCKEHGRLPDKSRAEANYHRHWQYLMHNYHDAPEVVGLREKYGRIYESNDERIDEVVVFANERVRLPVKSDGDIYLSWQKAKSWNNSRTKRGFPYDERVRSLIETYGRKKTDERVKEEFLAFVAEHHRLPSAAKSSPGEEKNLRAAVITRNLHVTDPEVKAVWDEYNTNSPRLTQEQKIVNMQRFTEKNGRPPRKNEPERQQWETICMYSKDDERVIAMKEMYGGQGKKDFEIERDAKKVTDYVMANGWPSTSNSDPSRPIYTLMINLKKNHGDHPAVISMLEAIAGKERLLSDDEVKRRIIAFTDKEHRLPSASSADKEEASLRFIWNARYDRLTQDPRMQAVADAYSRKPHVFEQSLSIVRDFCQREGRLPGKKDTDVYRHWDYLRSNHLHNPAVRDLAEKYGYRRQSPRIDIDGILSDIATFADGHGRLPSSAAHDRHEKQLGQRWCRLKRRYADHPTVIVLVEKYPLQNRR